jgi:hypothetical protein
MGCGGDKEARSRVPCLINLHTQAPIISCRSEDKVIQAKLQE